MTGIKTSTGLISGLNVGAIVDAVINAARAPAARLETRLTNTKTQQTGLTQLQAQLLALSSPITTLQDRKTFNSLAVQNSQSSQLRVTSKSTSLAGTYNFRAVKLATSQRAVSTGFANADTQQIGSAGTLIIARGGELDRGTKLDLLNNGQGVRRGSIRITDRSGSTADLDLSNAVTLTDVVNTINTATIGVTASAVDGRLELKDTTGATTSSLSVVSLNGGKTAEDLGLAQTVAAAKITGSDVYGVTEDFTFGLLNDGNGLRQKTGSDDLAITLTDGSSLSINLDGTATVGDVLAKINDHAGNAGKLTAALQNGRLVLTDHTTGSGTLSLANLSGSNAKEFLGLTNTSSSGVITGNRLAAGANSVLLRNLRGGQGITTPGSISLTDRTGATATLDLSSAESLDQVLAAINSAQTIGGQALTLEASLNSDGTGILIRDTSGSTASNLTIADVGGGTTAANLGIVVNSASTEVDSGSLSLRSVNEATSLDTYSPKGARVATGSFRITDSAGNESVVSITSNTKTIGDVLDAINTASNINVTARLNDTGDGFVIEDDAGGTGTLKVAEVGGRTATDLRIVGEGVDQGGQQEIVSRNVLKVSVDADDTLNDIVAKVNNIGGTVRASVVNSGTTLNGYRLSLNSTISGEKGRFHVDDGNLNFGFTTQETGQDAVLQIGSSASTGFLVTSSTNNFTNVVGNFDVSLLEVGTTSATVTASRDTSKIQTAVSAFVTAYNAYIDTAAKLTAYDSATNTRSALQGDPTTLNIASRFNSIFNKVTGASGDDIRSLADAGVIVTKGGKLSLDSERLSATIDANPDAVTTLFTDTTNGFAQVFDKALDSYTDQFDGSLTLQIKAFQTNANSLQQRIDAIDAQLDGRRTRLENQFAQMEAILSGLQSQQSSLTSLANLASSYSSSGK